MFSGEGRARAAAELKSLTRGPAPAKPGQPGTQREEVWFGPEPGGDERIYYISNFTSQS